MPYAINKTTGALEPVDALAPDHEIPIVAPDGTFGSVPEAEYGKLVKEGYRPPTSAEVKGEIDRDTYSTPGQQAAAFAEGAADAATLGLAAGAERALGVSPEGMQGRRKHAEGARLAGELTGFGASALLVPGGGAVGLMARAGESAAQMATSQLAKAAVKNAAEFAMMSAGDEVSKAFASDPEQTVESALTHIGLSSALGGSFGAGSSAAKKIAGPLWEASGAKAKVENILSTLRSKVDKVAIDELAGQAGLSVEPALAATMAGDRAAMEMGQGLREGATKAGRQYRSSLEGLERDAAEQSVTAMGRSMKDIEKIAERSEYEEGLSAQKALANEVRAEYAPIKKQYDSINKQLPKIELSQETKDAAAEKISKMALDDGFLALPDSEAANAVGKILKGLQSVKDAEGLRQLQSGVREELASKQLFGLSRKVSGLLRDTEERAVGEALGFKAPELLAEHEAARAGYRTLSEKLEQLSDRLRPGRWTGPEGFLKAVEEMAPETILKRLSGKGDAEMLQLLQSQFPGVANQVRQTAVNGLLKKAAISPKALEGSIDTRPLYKALDQLSPEMRSFLFDRSQQESLGAIQKILEKLPERLNPSGTARTLDAIGNIQGGIAGLIAAMSTGSLSAGVLFGALGKAIGREAPDALRLAFLKKMGSGAPANAEAFRSLVDMAQAAYKGAQTTERAVKGVFKGGVSNVIDFPSKPSLQRLDKSLRMAQERPETLLEGDDGAAHYAPDQELAKGNTKARASQLLNALRPSAEKAAPLDPPREPNAFEQAKFDRALTIAEQPLAVLDYVYNGTLTVDDIRVLSTIYPKQYATLQQKLIDQALKFQEGGGEIPYKTKMSMSLFLGMPLESSLQPQNIMGNQMLTPIAPQQGGPSAKPSQKGLEGLSKLPQTAATPQQARQQDKLSR